MNFECGLNDPQLFFNVVEKFVNLPSSVRLFVLAVVRAVFDFLDLLEKILERVCGLFRYFWLLGFFWFNRLRGRLRCGLRGRLRGRLRCRLRGGLRGGRLGGRRFGVFLRENFNVTEDVDIR